MSRVYGLTDTLDAATITPWWAYVVVFGFLAALVAVVVLNYPSDNGATRAGDSVGASQCGGIG